MTPVGCDFVVIAELHTDPRLEALTSLRTSSGVANKASRVEERGGGVAAHQPLLHLEAS